MSYQLSQPDANLLHAESWERILKFGAVNIAVGIVMTLLITLVMVFVSGISVPLALLLSLGIILAGTSYMLSTYEFWRGCNFAK